MTGSANVIEHIEHTEDMKLKPVERTADYAERGTRGTAERPPGELHVGNSMSSLYTLSL